MPPSKPQIESSALIPEDPGLCALPLRASIAISSAQPSHCMQRTPQQLSAHPGQGTQATGRSRVTWLQLLRDCPTSGRVKGLVLCSPHKDSQASEEQIWGFSQGSICSQNIPSHPPQAGPSPSSRKQEKAKSGLAWEPEDLALPLAIPITLGRSIT